MHCGQGVKQNAQRARRQRTKILQWPDLTHDFFCCKNAIGWRQPAARGRQVLVRG
jgi:hypothetical protein